MSVRAPLYAGPEAARSADVPTAAPVSGGIICLDCDEDVSPPADAAARCARDDVCLFVCHCVHNAT